MLAAVLSLLTEGDADRFAGLAVRLAQPGDGEEVLQGWAVATDSRDEALSQQVSSGISTTCDSGFGAIATRWWRDQTCSGLCQPLPAGGMDAHELHPAANPPAANSGAAATDQQQRP